jgi:1-deoxy-D-xylulose-5-phosphate reductoisomerase
VGRDPLKPLVVLGATGSIGRQTIDVADRIGVPIHAIAARRASDGLLELGRKLPDASVFVVDPGDRRDAFAAEFGDRLHIGPGSITEVAATPGVTVVNAIVGAAGLSASLSALYAGNRLALANKESLVAGGPLVEAALRSDGAELIPIDSEHSAIWQCLVGEDRELLQRVILTASGGPFRGRTVDQLADVTPDQALEHPTWSMGARITIDSATLMNKAFEVIEAHYLFGIAYDQIDVVIHPQSIVHSFVEFGDGVVKAEVGRPDMRKPIQYAITTPERSRYDFAPMDLVGTDLTFEAVDRSLFRCLDLGYAAGRTGGTAPAVLNAADEVAVEAFLEGRLPFLAIADVVEHTLGRHAPFAPDSLDAVLEADAEARAIATEACAAHRID